MTPYIAILIFTVIISFVSRQSRNGAIRKFSIFGIIILLTLFGGLRDIKVGSDTFNYVTHFQSVASFENIWVTTEIGYNALELLCAKLSDNYAVLLTTISLIVVGCYVAGITLTTKRYETALFLFITLGVYTFFFNGARQGIALSLCFLGLPWLLDRRPLPYFLLVGLAALFHHTALIAAPLFYLAVPRTGSRQLVAIFFGIVAMVVFLSFFVQVAAELLANKYAVYSEAGDGGGQVMTIFLIAQGVLLYLLKDQVNDPDGRYHRLLNIYLIGLVPAIAATLSKVDPSGLLRLSAYFSHTAVLLWPMVFVGIKSPSTRGLFSQLFLIVTLVFFMLTTSTFSNLSPYQINSEFAW